MVEAQRGINPVNTKSTLELGYFNAEESLA